MPVRIVKTDNCQADLLQMVAALHATRRLAGGLNGRQLQGDQYADKGDHHQQLDERETRPTT